MNKSPNQTLQRTPGFGVQLPSTALIRPAQSRAVRPAMKPGTARGFDLGLKREAVATQPPEVAVAGSGCLDSHQKLVGRLLTPR